MRLITSSLKHPEAWFKISCKKIIGIDDTIIDRVVKQKNLV